MPTSNYKILTAHYRSFNHLKSKVRCNLVFLSLLVYQLFSQISKAAGTPVDLQFFSEYMSHPVWPVKSVTQIYALREVFRRCMDRVVEEVGCQVDWDVPFILLSFVTYARGQSRSPPIFKVREAPVGESQPVEMVLGSGSDVQFWQSAVLPRLLFHKSGWWQVCRHAFWLAFTDHCSLEGIRWQGFSEDARTGPVLAFRGSNGTFSFGHSLLW